MKKLPLKFFLFFVAVLTAGVLPLQGCGQGSGSYSVTASDGSGGGSGGSGGGGDGRGGSGGGGTIPSGSLSVALSWRAPSQSDLGGTLNPQDLTGYKVYIGMSSGQYAKAYEITGGSQTTHTVQSLGAGTYYIAVSALTGLGGESATSNEMMVVVQ